LDERLAHTPIAALHAEQLATTKEWKQSHSPGLQQDDANARRSLTLSEANERLSEQPRPTMELMAVF